MLRRLLLATALPLLALPASASAAATSSNWAGYAVHRSGVHFKSITASWTVPAVTCDGGAAYSATWVGIGGFHTNAAALEQAGTESDCSRSGRATYSAWYELVPDASKTLKLTVGPGDNVTVRVSVAGKQVTVALRDNTRGKRVTHTLTAAAVDTTSAEWIVEAPSECAGARCRVLPLASFADTTFTSARAVSTTGHAGTISDPTWAATPIDLASDGPQFGGPRGRDMAVRANATTGALSADGASFTVATS